MRYNERATAWLLLQQRLDATAQFIAALHVTEQHAPARKRRVRLMTARKRSAYFTSAFYLGGAL